MDVDTLLARRRQETENRERLDTLRHSLRTEMEPLQPAQCDPLTIKAARLEWAQQLCKFAQVAEGAKLLAPAIQCLREGRPLVADQDAASLLEFAGDKKAEDIEQFLSGPSDQAACHEVQMAVFRAAVSIANGDLIATEAIAAIAAAKPVAASKKGKVGRGREGTAPTKWILKTQARLLKKNGSRPSEADLLFACNRFGRRKGSDGKLLALITIKAIRNARRWAAKDNKRRKSSRTQRELSKSTATKLVRK